MGLMDYIRNQLPEAWDKAATGMRMKSELITRIHRNVPKVYKNKYHYKEGMRYVQGIFQTKSCSIIYLVEATDINVDKWNELNLKIREYENQCM